MRTMFLNSRCCYFMMGLVFWVLLIAPAMAVVSNISRGQDAFFKNDFEGALKYFNKELLSNPDNPIVLFFVGQCRFKLKQYKSARDNFEKALQLKPKYRLARLGIARTCFAAGDADCALKHYRIIEKLSPGELTDKDRAAIASIGTPVLSPKSKAKSTASSAAPELPKKSLAVNKKIQKTKSKNQPGQAKYIALLMAVNTYQDPAIQDLSNPVSDAEALRQILIERYTFNSKYVLMLKNPTRARIINTFQDLSQTVREQDNLLIFFAGHGVWDQTIETGYWLPSDAGRKSHSAWLSNSTIRDFIRGIKTKHTLLIADACFSGGIFKTRAAFQSFSTDIKALYRLPSRKAITSGTLSEVPDDSVFIHFLLKRLAANSAKYTTSQILFASLRAAVINNSVTEQVPQYGTIFGCGDEGGDFIFILR